MDYGERTTGTRDEHYNLVSVLYHALHGAENCAIYAEDAEATDDERLANFFGETQAMQTQVAERPRGCSASRAGRQEPGAVAPGAPLTTDVPRTPPWGTPGDVERGTTPDAPLAPPEEAVPPDIAAPPDEERLPREEPPPGEERPGKRTPWPSALIELR